MNEIRVAAYKRIISAFLEGGGREEAVRDCVIAFRGENPPPSVLADALSQYEEVPALAPIWEAA